MSYEEKILKVIEGIDTGDAKFIVRIYRNSIRPQEKNWSAGLSNSDFYSQLVNRNVRRFFDVEKKAYSIDVESVTQNIKQTILSDVRMIFQRCSPAKQPRRTKIYKSFMNMLSENTENEELINALFDIEEYYWNVTQTDSIDKGTNDVHRKNVYKLLCLMEKNYGRKEAKASSDG
jgi:hypothetical protein